LGEVLPLSASLPVFENLGLKVIAEDAFPVSFTRADGARQEAVILDFLMERADGIAAQLDAIREPLEDAIHAVLRGEAESDGFNRLVMGAGLGWRDVVILRALAKFLRQAAVTFSQDYMEHRPDRKGAARRAQPGRRPHHPPLPQHHRSQPANQLLAEGQRWSPAPRGGDQVRFRRAR
jgi:glutamate dehydrogenase